MQIPSVPQLAGGPGVLSTTKRPQFIINWGTQIYRSLKKKKLKKFSFHVHNYTTMIIQNITFDFQYCLFVCLQSILLYVVVARCYKCYNKILYFYIILIADPASSGASMVYVVVGGKEIRLFDVNIELFLENPILFLSITKITYIQVQYITAYSIYDEYIINGISSIFTGTNENKKCRKFSVEYYFTTNLSGQKILRSWLCYSVILDKAYYESCWLFSDRTHPYFKSNWIKGINDWRHLSQKINKYEISIQHMEVVKLRTIWVKNQTIDQSIEDQISKEAQQWRDILTRLIKIILFLTAGNTAFRGNEGKSTSTSMNEDNFI